MYKHQNEDLVKLVNAQLDDIAGRRINVKNEYGYGHTNDMVATKIFLHIDSLICDAIAETLKGDLLLSNIDKFAKAKDLSDSYTLGISRCLEQHHSLIESQPSLVKKLLQAQNLDMWIANTSGWNNCWAGWPRRQSLPTHDGFIAFNGYHEGLHIFRVQFNNEPPIWACSHQSIPIPTLWMKGDPLSVAILDNYTDKLTDVKVHFN